jgi:uncharacterized membrane protein YfcA
MDIQSGLMLVGAGLVGGTISSLVGGAAIVTFPALIAAGLPPVVATATNLVALVPGNFLAALYDRKQLPAFDRSFIALILASLVGAGFGAVLLLLTPERMFAAFVPALLGFATILFAYAGRISAWIRARAARRGDRAASRWGNSIAALTLVSIYGGYFGAGLGVLLLGVLSIGTNGDYRAANVIKNLVTSLSSLTAAVVFVAQDKVSWPATLAMMAGGLVGALVGARLAQTVPREVMRVVVVAMGVLLTAAFAWRYWF